MAATAMPMASSVITVNAPLATVFSARNNVISMITPKKPAAASVNHIGKVGERQIGSSDVAHAQFMRDVPSRSKERIERKQAPQVAAAPAYHAYLNRAF